MAGLTNRQRAFIEHYLKHWNATRAAELAGYSKRTANQQGPRLLVNVGIKDAISARLGELKMGADEVLVLLASHARADMDDFIGSMDRIDLDRARERKVMHLVKKIKQKTTTFSKSSGDDVETHDVELELHDAQSALSLLGRHHKLFTEKLEVTGKDGGPLEVRAFDYGTAITPITAGPEPDSDPSGESESDRDGPALGEDADGG